jgi:hypothetical protein
MRREIRRKLSMAEGARDFCRLHPSTAESQTAILARVEELLRRADSLAVAERAGRLEELSAANRRQVLRRSAKFELLRHLVRVGQLAGKDNPGLAGKFHLRSPDATHRSFLASTRQMLAVAQANKDLLVSLGLSDTLLPELEGAVAQFEEAMTSGRNGRSEHVAARTQLDAVVAELVEKVELLNGLNRYRFRKDPDLLAAWEAVRVIGPRTRTSPAGPTGSGVTPPAGGAVAPAA